MHGTKALVLRDPFNPKTGEFKNNIRSLVGDDSSELRASMKQFGWMKEFPAIADERGVILVGHRRIKLAKQLHIKPVIKKLKFGKGSAADAERMKLAIVSNIGFKPLSKEDRKRIAEHLYGNRQWTMERIAQALDVSQMTISRDLEGSNTMVKPPRPKGGRPKGSGKAKTKKAAKKTAAHTEPEEETHPDDHPTGDEGASIRDIRDAAAEDPTAFNNAFYIRIGHAAYLAKEGMPRVPYLATKSAKDRKTVAEMISAARATAEIWEKLAQELEKIT